MQRDGRQGRRVARALIGLAIGYGLAILSLWVFLGRDFMEPTSGLAPSYGWVAAIVGVASYVLGLGWMIRTYRAQREPDERSWRYRDTDDTNRVPVLRTSESAAGRHPRDLTLGQRRRRIARGLIVLAIVYGLVAVFFYVTQTGFMDPKFVQPQSFEIPLPIAGVASYVIGLGWMVRIYRAKPEPGERTWRYRDH